MPKIKDKILWIAVILLGGYLLYRFFDLRKLIYIFPLDINSDVSAHMALFYFLLKCGYHQVCQYWYNGMILFEMYPPGWAFFIYPIYLLTKNIQLSTYISMILLYLIGFFIVFSFGKKFRFNILQRILLFLFFFANPITIGNFLKLGRVSSLLSWIFALFIILFILNYKDKKINYKFLIISLFFAGVIFSHQPETLLSFFMILCLFMKKRELKEIFIVGLSLFIGLLISAIWWVRYLFAFFNTDIGGGIPTLRLLDFSGQWIITSLMSFFVVFGFLFISLFYFNKKKKDFKFFLPIIILSILFVSRLIIFIPFFKRIYPDEYMLFFILISGYMLFNLRLSKKLKNIFVIGILFISLISVVFSAYYTPFFKEHTDTEKDVLSLLDKIEGKFVIYGVKGIFFKYPMYCYANIYHDLKTPSGWLYTEVDQIYIRELDDIFNNFKNKNYSVEKINKYSIETIISYKYCDILEEEGFKKLGKEKNICVYLVSQ